MEEYQNLIHTRWDCKMNENPAMLSPVRRAIVPKPVWWETRGLAEPFFGEQRVADDGECAQHEPRSDGAEQQHFHGQWRRQSACMQPLPTRRNCPKR